MGRPRIKVDPALVTELAKIHCTYDEIAAVTGVSTDTLKRRFADCIEKGREVGKSSLRKAQFHKAINDGNPTMLIWLGKQHLGQSDKTEVDVVNAQDTARMIHDALSAIDQNATTDG